MRGSFWYRLLCRAGRAAPLQYERPPAILGANTRRLDHHGWCSSFFPPKRLRSGFLLSAFAQ